MPDLVFLIPRKIWFCWGRAEVAGGDLARTGDDPAWTVGDPGRICDLRTAVWTGQHPAAVWIAEFGLILPVAGASLVWIFAQ